MDSSLDQLTQDLLSAVENMSREQLRWHPPGKWCVGEILEHLYLSYTGTVKGFERVMNSGKPLASPASLKHRVRALVVVGLGYMPKGRTAPPPTRPKGMPAEEIRKQIGISMAEMNAIIGRCQAGFGSKVKVLDHPILGPLSASQWRKFHVVHGRHHWKQILRLREQMEKRSRD